MSLQTQKIRELVEKRAKARLGGGEKAIEKQHAKGKLTARERIALLLDEGSFEELDMFKLHRCHNFGMEKKQYLGDGVVTGSGTINGRLVYVYAQDFTVNGGSLSITMAEKICKVQDLAMKMGAPCIAVNDSGGARIQEGIDSLAGFGDIFQRNIESSGVIPQISMICGPCAGGAVYSPALTDFVVMLEGVSYMFLTGPKVVKTVTGEDVSSEDLGGASVHGTKSGVAHFTAKTEEEAAELVKNLLSFIPQNNMEEAPRVECNDPIDRKEDMLNEIIPDSANMAYDMYKVIGALVDNGEFFEVHANFAKNIIVGFARFNGQSVGIIAKTDAPHNTLAPIARKEGGEYFLYLLLRNNRCDEENPDGIFHAHKEYHNIKSESIGLIEAMGRFILPGRLEYQLKEVEKFLTGENKEIAENMTIHKNMISSLLKEYGDKLSEEQAHEAVFGRVEKVCESILDNTAVFKRDGRGRAAFLRFLSECGFSAK